MLALGRNISAELIPIYAMAATSVTAAGSGDATAITGATIDKNALATRGESIVFLVTATASLTATKTLVVTAVIEDSANGSTWATLVESSTILTLTATGTSTGAGKVGVDLNKARRYVRIVATPDMSATGTDTSVIQGIAAVAGLQEAPQ